MEMIMFIVAIVVIVGALAYFGKLGSIGAKIKNLITAAIDKVRGDVKKD